MMNRLFMAVIFCFVAFGIGKSATVEPDAPAQGVDIFVQAEDIFQPRSVPNPGYAFIDQADATSGWATIHSSPSPGFPNEPAHFRLSFNALPAGPYRLWARLARWGGTPDTTPIIAARFTDSAGNNLRYLFPDDRAQPLGAWFGMLPGGMIPADGEWGWLPLFETKALTGDYELVISGEPGTDGAGNYKGLWIDAFRFEAIGEAAMPRLPEDDSLPGRWEGGCYLTPRAPREGGLSVSFPRADDAGQLHSLRRIFDRPVDAGLRDHLAMWVCSEVRTHALELTVTDVDGWALKADVCRLANDRPLEPGIWYYVLLPLRNNGTVADTAHRRLAGLELGLPLHDGGKQEAVIAIHQPHLVSLAEAREEMSGNDAKLLTIATGSARLAAAVLDFPREPVGPDKKVIMWARGGWGGTPSPDNVRQRITELRDSGADGIVLTLTPLAEGKPVYFADAFMSAQRFGADDFAADLTELRNIDWGPLDHSLLRIDVMPGTVDWFDEEWSAVVEKAGQAAMCCREGRLAGFLFDVEQYHWERGIFRYDNRLLKTTKTLAEYAAQARLRGQQMARAMVAEMPDIDVLTTYAGSLQGEGSELLLPFLEGMASVPGCHVYDGCEVAYPFRTLRHFIEWKGNMRNFSKSIGAGFGLWVNHPAGPFDRANLARNYRPPEGLAHSLHYALRMADKYVWLYAEGDLTFWPETTPAEYYTAIKQAREPRDPRWVP